MDQVRFGIIGTGGMGSGHANTIQNIEECQLVAACDIDPDAVKAVKDKYGVETFTNYKELIDSGLVDAVIAATPHYFHPIVGIYAMNKGIAVLSEKPMAVTVKAADEMVKVAKETGVPFTIMYQWRTTGRYQAAHKIIQEGELGELYRTCLIDSGFRSQAYYNSAPWRGTWKEEGGGVLINQAPHALDMFTWLGGLPCRVTARTANRRHQMECEDEASAMLEYPNGAIGFLHVSTSESPGTSLMEFCGEKAKLVMRGRPELYKLGMPLQEYSDTIDNMWGKAKSEKVDVEIEDRESGHGAIIRNLAKHILYGEPLIVPGEEGINSMELINAVILSGQKGGKPVEIPVDREEYEAFIEDLKKTSKVEKSGTAKRVTDPQHVK